MLSANRFWSKRSSFLSCFYYPRMLFGVSNKLLQQVTTQTKHVDSLRKKGEKQDVLRKLGQTDSSSIDIGLNDIETLEMKKVKITKEVLPFDDIPGPKWLKYIASFWKAIPVAGSNLTVNHRLLNPSFFLNNYGPVVRLHGPFGGDLVLLNKPRDIQLVFQQEGSYAVRSALDSLEKYRVKHRNYNFAGPYNGCGSDWEKIRSQLSMPLKTLIDTVSSNIDKNSNKFVNSIATNRNCQDEITTDFSNDLFKWSLECIGNMMFPSPLGLLNSGNSTDRSDGVRMYNALLQASKAMVKCESGLQLWKLFTTRTWQQLVDNCDVLDNLIGKNIREVETELTAFANKEKVMKDEQASLIKMLLINDGMKSDDILTSVMDILLIGVTATTSAMEFLLYHLAKSQNTQKKLFHELVNIAPKLNTEITMPIIKTLPYLQACVKESLRLIAPIPVLTRVLSKNIIIDGYNIPKGTFLLMASQDACLKEENFEDALKYNPERWLKADANEIHPFSTIPFGYGTRKCIGQEFSELQLATLTAKIIRSYVVEYPYGDIKVVRQFISKPNKPLKFRFIDRE